MANITVTQELIEKGRKSDPFRCPIALAFKAAGYTSVRILYHEGRATKSKNGPTKEFNLTKKAIDFIKAFDESGKKAVKPSTFRITGV